MGKIMKQLKVVGGIDYQNRTVFFAIGDWFALLGGTPDRNSVYVKVGDQVVSR